MIRWANSLPEGLAAMSNEILVSAEKLNRFYGRKPAVIDLDLELRQGEILGLLGPNGAGKTTTLRMLAGCLAPSSGRVRIRGFDMADEPSRAKARLGYLPERPPLYPELTVDEYLGFCARLHGVARGGRRAALASAKRDCGLADTGRRLIGNLSKGYQQRVGIAQAILHRPDVVILDEPTVGLDPNQIREIRGLIARLGGQHSVLLSSHILPEIRAACTRVAIIHDGRVVFNRSMAEIQDNLEDIFTRLTMGEAA
jgi:ABC-2 type transport system ATP-binding protein